MTKEAPPWNGQQKKKQKKKKKKTLEGFTCVKVPTSTFVLM